MVVNRDPKDLKREPWEDLGEECSRQREQSCKDWSKSRLDMLSNSKKAGIPERSK